MPGDSRPGDSRIGEEDSRLGEEDSMLCHVLKIVQKSPFSPTRA
jgi:hypothetical protein